MAADTGTLPHPGADSRVQFPNLETVRETGLKTLLEVLRLATGYLEEKGIQPARLEAEKMLASVVGTNRLGLYLKFDRPLADPELDRLRQMLRRRIAREPLQYIIGETGFRELSLRVGPGVMVPRPETEGLVQLVLDWLDRRRADPGKARREFKVIELCCGSGAAGLSTALERDFVNVLLSDISIESLKYAAENSGRLGAKLAGRVNLLCSDLFAAVGKAAGFDVVMANPPYVSPQEMQSLPDEVRLHEPRMALDGGEPDGTVVIGRIVAEADDFLAPGGLLALEIGERQRAPVGAIFEKCGAAYTECAFHPDLAGRTRYVTAEKS
ncbi:MAG: peptide chain release factor N(5)-glutamine methyltransferase [Candidatus Glassbacteria bacterium]